MTTMSDTNEPKTVVKPKSSMLGSMGSPPSAESTPAVIPGHEEVRYRVLEDTKVPRPGAIGQYHLSRGKIISSRGYDIARLKEMGVSLEQLK